MSAVNTAKREIAEMTRIEGEGIEEFAVRRYLRQLEVYSSYAMGDLYMPFNSLDHEARKGWFASTREALGYIKKIDTPAPRDGTHFWAVNDVTNHEFETWFDDSMKPADALTAAFTVGPDELGKWWCKDKTGRVTSFIFQEWRPM